METTQVVWLVLLIIFVVLEGATATLVSIWFCAGALVALIVSLFWPAGIAVQIAAFVVVSVLALLALRPLAKRLVGGKRVATNADASVGKYAQVTGQVSPGRFGRVRLEGLEWTAKADDLLPVGSWCRVVAIEGVKLVVVPAPNGPGAEEQPNTPTE